MGSHFEKVSDLLRLEAASVVRAADRLVAEDIERSIDLILNCNGKVIVLGVGKSGVIAQKIAQTMTSTGTVAIYLHPSDALHGSLGIVAKGDVVIALSNSGETDEINSLLPPLRARGVKILAIVGDLNSTLARNADIALDASVDKEACPLNLAPTTSTTVALSIGDALAMTLMEAKGLTAEDFAMNHPAGRLGKRLTMRVGSLMQPSPNVSPETGWLGVVKAISDGALGAVNVVGGDDHLVGIVTDGDLRRTIERTPADELLTLTAEQMMTAEPITVTDEMLAYDALRIMEDRPSQISVLPVLNISRKCVGMLRLHDIVKAGI
ncbi:SIS domain-containing protein [Leptolyngbya sp. 7M]|uniref:KpsF/GutQ family sugar-phosphate isomerase n=1 Tax=Leptolyngbya sp. 7M TaxID=2812896 RepID=UPI0021F12060|nr:KpsF/GutQ family sugar-phosphate isomerase [Leptolyngbya sp. 7M]